MSSAKCWPFCLGLNEIMCSHLFGAKIIYQPVLEYCQLNPQEQFTVKLELKYKDFYSRKLSHCCPFLFLKAIGSPPSPSGGVNTLRPRQNRRHFTDDIFKCIFLNANVWIPIKISMMFVPKGPINNIPALVQIMACCRPGDKPLSEPMMVGLTHWGQDKTDAISQTTFSNAFSWMKMFEFLLKFHWSLFLRVQLTIFQRPGDKPLSEPMMVKLLTHICITRPQWVNDAYMRHSASMS